MVSELFAAHSVGSGVEKAKVCADFCMTCYRLASVQQRSYFFTQKQQKI